MGGYSYKTRQAFVDHCLTYPDAYEDYPFDDCLDIAGAWTVMRHRLNKSGFASIYERNGLCLNVKCEPMCADLFRQVYEGVLPAYHMNKEHWNTVQINSDVLEPELYAMIDHSYKLTMPKCGNI